MDKQVQVQPLEWGEHKNLKADLILGADLLYDQGKETCFLRACCWYLILSSMK
jgi:hypothetical protein